MKNFELHITTSCRQALIDHAKAALPNESCGYLGGNIQDGVVTVSTFYPMINVDNSPEHFSFDPKEQFKVVKAARSANESLIAVYHSHPETPARLSEEDLKLFNDPNPVYIIVSLKDNQPDVQGYKVFKENDHSIEVYKVNIIQHKEAINEVLSNAS